MDDSKFVTIESLKESLTIELINAKKNHGNEDIYSIQNSLESLYSLMEKEGLVPSYITMPSRPKQPKSPIVINDKTLKQHSENTKQYLENLEQYNSDMSSYKEVSKLYSSYKRLIYEVLEEHLKEESGLYAYVPEQNQKKVWSKAWQLGHSSGYSEVYNHLIELVELFED